MIPLPSISFSSIGFRVLVVPITGPASIQFFASVRQVRARKTRSKGGAK